VAQAFLGLGSNINREKNIAFALQSLWQQFGELQRSAIYESESVGFAGSHFHNLVVKISTSLTLVELSKTLRSIEDAAGRDRSKPKFSPRTLDIDILLYDNCVGDFDGIQLPRDEILKNAFVLLPLSELAPDLLHPVQKKSFAQLWQEFDKSKQKLWRLQS
jgi:2-amino-4-hydroxy-6-hydroxymethyldihydropteridine diphosphokinase